MTADSRGSSGLFARPRTDLQLRDCDFYHTMDLPSVGTVNGPWDLRGREAEYLGHVRFDGKRVLEIGPASGHLSFFMERAGAEVVCCDLDETHEWDLVPFADLDVDATTRARSEHIRRLNNSFWFAHEKLRSNVRVFYSAAYDLPEAIGTFDVSTVCSVLLHVRDPFLVLQRAAERTEETIIVTDVPLSFFNELASLLRRRAVVKFLPDPAKFKPLDAWWQLSARVVAEWMRILGFPTVEVFHHNQLHQGRQVWLFTLVGRRHAKDQSQRRLRSPFSRRTQLTDLLKRAAHGMRHRLASRS
jgi:SAM-dependent methyltransferase